MKQLYKDYLTIYLTNNTKKDGSHEAIIEDYWNNKGISIPVSRSANHIIVLINKDNKDERIKFFISTKMSNDNNIKIYFTFEDGQYDKYSEKIARDTYQI